MATGTSRNCCYSRTYNWTRVRWNASLPGSGAQGALTDRRVLSLPLSSKEGEGNGVTASEYQDACEVQRFPAQFQVADFLRATSPFLFDWVFEHTLFCAIQPGERDEYVRALLRWLKPGGQYLAVNYLIPDRDGPPFGTTRDELRQRFSPHFDPVQEWVPRSYPNRTGLELMLWWRRSGQDGRPAAETEPGTSH